ncbi:hypothetical protein SPRG_07197 [Saprolegnia parasitica CBS 223.65]|uniref:RWD domain-containing protein n=1 Tax=Saprolegnia parasitica (strain CBS 223.65) TaxID=695850 RepID=A0A067CBN8_SAPPC|nr:hypothetical protein SPRG_07197 [Saprolegnia parasitica CBS 223.65]KDO27923.1 hypothetical protein SPRG_07197 [Saprolegnia parasitica CBS 223.65]|eukprot:XP_012201379.1 hypothetical protein SPRG_07197 [Saprolegnia parasitica CBS 223.65]
MFPGDDELVIDAYVHAIYESAAAASSAEAITLPRLVAILRFQTCLIENAAPELELQYPATYPSSAMAFELRCPTLSRREKHSIVDRLASIANDQVGEVVALQLYQAAAEILQEIQDEAHLEAPALALQPLVPIAQPCLGRRAIYFHHIIASSKRRVVIDWAKELHLGGFSKIGWPGVIIVEGDEPCVAEYVRRLQHLRWKQMVVRGEQVETSSEALRRLPSPLTELDDMSILAAACADAGVTDLFLTTMKIYR